MDAEQITAIRQSDSLPVLQELKTWMLVELPEVWAKSSIGQAITYSLHRWDKLSIYTTDSRL